MYGQRGEGLMDSVGIVLLANTTVTGASTDVDPKIGVDKFTAADIVVSLNSVAGTGSLKVFVQKGFLTASASDLAGGILSRDNDVVFDDFYASTSLTTADTRDIGSVISGGSKVHAPTDGTMTAGSIQ